MYFLFCLKSQPLTLLLSYLPLLLLLLCSAVQAHPRVQQDGRPPGRAARSRPHCPAGGANDADQRLGPAARLHAAPRQAGEPRGEEGPEAGRQRGAQGERGSQRADRTASGGPLWGWSLNLDQTACVCACRSAGWRRRPTRRRSRRRRCARRSSC